MKEEISPKLLKELGSFQINMAEEPDVKDSHFKPNLATQFKTVQELQ